MVFWSPSNGVLTHLPDIMTLLSRIYFDHLPMIYRPPYPWYFDPPHHPWYFDPPTHGISTILLMVFWPPIHGIKTHLPMVFCPLLMVYGAPYPWYIDTPTHGILTPIHGIKTHLPMIFWPPIYGISTPLPMVFWPSAYLLIRKEGGQNTIWHRSFLHSWPITGFVIRLTRRVPLVAQEQLTIPEHPSSVLVFSGVCVTRSLVLCVCFVDHCLSFCPFLPLCCPSFDFRILITPFGFGILKLFLRKAVIHFPIGSYVKNCHVSGI
jgi:hypothetical protein